MARTRNNRTADVARRRNTRQRSATHQIATPHRRINARSNVVDQLIRFSPSPRKRLLNVLNRSVCWLQTMINYYPDMWQRRSHILALLTAMCSAKAKFVWGDKEQKAFKDIRAIISWERLLTYPDFSKDFHIYTDSSDYQLGTVIMQDDRPLAFYSRKLNSAQKHCTTGKQELLSIVETLKEFKNILLGQNLIVHTDHKNLLYQKMSTDHIIWWRLLIEEFGPTFLQVKGEKISLLMHNHDWMQTSMRHYQLSLQTIVWHISS